MVVWLHGRMEKDGDKEDGRKGGEGGGESQKVERCKRKHGEERQFSPNSHPVT